MPHGQKDGIPVRAHDPVITTLSIDITHKQTMVESEPT